MTLCVQGMIFDFDGTLAHLTLDFSVMRRRALDAARSVTETMQHQITPYMPPNSPRPDLLPNDDGRPVLEWLAAAHSRVALHCTAIADSMVAAAHAAIEDVEVEAAGRSALFPWTRPLLETLRNDDIPVGIITRNCRKAVLAVFPDILEFSRCLLTREDVPYVKPHPEHLLRALARIGCLPQHCIMVGDHPMDIETGKAGGTLTAGVASGNTPHHILAAAHPDYLAADCQELYKQLSNRCVPCDTERMPG